jgi:2,3-bisphosphoglycerate-dependent phosphoglycerate mutase
MHLFFIRHGQSANNHLWEQTGSNRGRSEDPELTETGQQQALRLADFVRRIDQAARAPAATSGSPNGDGAASQGSTGSSVVNELRRDYFGFTHLYTSLMVRSVLTGIPLAEAAGVPLQGWVDIHETGGIFLDDEVSGEPQGLPGRARSYFMQRFETLILPETVNEDGWWNRPFEDDLQRTERARRVLIELLQRHGGTNDRVALVSHGAFYNHLMRAIFGGEPNHTWWVMNNTGITRVDFSEAGRTMLIYHNRTDHLPEELIT